MTRTARIAATTRQTELTRIISVAVVRESRTVIIGISTTSHAKKVIIAIIRESRTVVVETSATSHARKVIVVVIIVVIVVVIRERRTVIGVSATGHAKEVIVIVVVVGISATGHAKKVVPVIAERRKNIAAVIATAITAGSIPRIVPTVPIPRVIPAVPIPRIVTATRVATARIVPSVPIVPIIPIVPIAPIPSVIATKARRYTQITVAVTANALSGIAEKQVKKAVVAGVTTARVTAAGITTAAGTTVVKSRITYIAHSISVPLVYLRRNLILQYMSTAYLFVHGNLQFHYFGSNPFLKDEVVFNKQHRRRVFFDQPFDLFTGIHVDEIERFVPNV